MSTAEPLFEGPTKNNSPNLIEHYMQVLSTPCILLAFLGTLIWEFWIYYSSPVGVTTTACAAAGLLNCVLIKAICSVIIVFAALVKLLLSVYVLATSKYAESLTVVQYGNSISNCTMYLLEIFSVVILIILSVLTYQSQCSVTQVELFGKVNPYIIAHWIVILLSLIILIVSFGIGCIGGMIANRNKGAGVNPNYVALHPAEDNDSIEVEVQA